MQPKRLEQIRCLVLDETIGDPSIVFAKRKHWNRIWRTIAKMTRLRVLYMNVDTLYPRLWGADFEKRLLGPLAAVTQLSELCVIVRWKEPVGLEASAYPEYVRRNIWRVNEFELPDDFYGAYPPADMRAWIMGVLRSLESGEDIGKRKGMFAPFESWRQST